MKRTLLTLTLLLLFNSGCGFQTVCPRPSYAPAPGMVNHVVFFDLMDPVDSNELIDNCYYLLESPGAKSGYVGKHFDIGRSTVLQDYDVGFFIAFANENEYRLYVEHPLHAALVEKWKPRCDSIRVYDVGDARSIRAMSDQ